MSTDQSPAQHAIAKLALELSEVARELPCIRDQQRSGSVVWYDLQDAVSLLARVEMHLARAELMLELGEPDPRADLARIGNADLLRTPNGRTIADIVAALAERARRQGLEGAATVLEVTTVALRGHP